MKILFSAIFIFLAAFVLRAEEVFFHHYGINQGLSSNVVYGIAEDKNGLLWIATTEGVDKFDGLHFKHYQLPQIDLNGVLDFMEFYIESDSKGQIWLITRTGLVYKFNTYNDEFQLVYRFELNETLVRVKDFYIDKNDNLLVSINNGVWILNNTSLLKKLLTENSRIFSIEQDKNHNYYWGDNLGIQRADTSFQKIKYIYTHNKSGTFNQRISKIYIDNTKQTLWGISGEDGVFYINLSTNKVVFPPALKRYKDLAIRTINYFSENEIVIGVDGVGLVIWNTSTQKVTQEIIYEDGKKGTLSSNAIYNIYRNKDEILYISTHRGGINVYNPNKLHFGYINATPGSKNSLSNNYILSLHELSPGKIAFGTYEGISIWDKNFDSWQQLSNKNNKISEVILSIDTDDKNNIWATSFTNSLMFFENKKSTNKKNRIFSNLPKIVSKKIFIDKQNRVWLTNHDGIYLYQNTTNQLEHFPMQGLLTLSGLTENLLVLGTENGLAFFDTEKFKLQSFEFIESENAEMRLIKCLRLDEREKLWVGTKTDGIFIVDFYNEEIRNLTVEQGLQSNHIFGIAIGKKDVWVSTLKGISKIDRDFGIVNYTGSDGIVSIDFNYDAALGDSEGKLYFGTNEGVVTLNPNDIPSDVPHKNIILSEFRLNHKRILPGKNSPLKTETNNTSKLILGHAQSSFSFGFESVDFIQPERGVIHWKLENFDDDWLTSVQLGNISYTNLNAGKYTFKIKVLDERGELISNEKTIDITILRPWWFTGWAFVAYGIILLLLFWTILFFYRLRMNSKSSSERLGFMINLAHEIKTPLLLIKAPLNDLMSNEKITGVVRKNVNIALSSTDRLHKQMIQFLDMGNLSKIENTLSLEHTDIIQFINEKITAFRVLAEKKSIALSFSSQRADFCIKMDKKILDKILSNLISNAIKYSNDGGKVTVELRIENEFCKIIIADTGIGILKSEQRNIFKPFYRTERAIQSGSTGNGMGLVLASNLAKLLKGKLSLLESSESGTSFEFKFPFKASEKENVPTEATEEQLNTTENKTKLLLVEDDEDLLDFSVSKLQEHYQVITAKNGIEALEKCNKTLPNIIISDVIMPKMNGLQFCMKLKTDVKTSHIPVILFTGLDSKEEILEGLEAGADDYIVKPFEFEILIKKVETLLNNRLILQKKFLYQTDENENIGFASKLDDEWINKVNKFVEEHIEDTDLTPPVLCQNFGMSRSAFYHKTKTLVNLSPIELIRTIRLKRAKALLGSTNNDISEVAYKVGFNDPKYFSTVFKKYFGQTPTSFIAQKKTLHEN